MKYSTRGKITVECKPSEEPAGLRREGHTTVEIVVADTGCGISPAKLESIFREFEQVEPATPRSATPGLGLGLAVVARIVKQLGGQLRVESKVNEGSRFTLLTPFALAGQVDPGPSSTSSRVGCGSRKSGNGNDIDDLVKVLASNHMPSPNLSLTGMPSQVLHADTAGSVEIPDSNTPLRAVKVDPVVAVSNHPHGEASTVVVAEIRPDGDMVSIPARRRRSAGDKGPTPLRVLIVEVRLSVPF